MKIFRREPRTKAHPTGKVRRLTGKKRHRRITEMELKFIENAFKVEMSVRKTIARSHAEVIEERGVKYDDQPSEIKEIVNEIYWTKYRRFHRVLDEIVGTSAIVLGAFAEMEPIMQTGIEIAERRHGRPPGSPFGSLRKSRKRLRMAIAASGDGRVSSLRQIYPRVGVDVNGNLIFKPGKRSEQVEEFIMRHLNIGKHRHK